MATSLQSRTSNGLPRAIGAASSAGPRILVVIYGNPNYHPPTINGVRIMSERFAVNVVCRNEAGPDADWPHSVAIDRVGELLTANESFGANVWRKFSWYRTFVRRVAATIAETRPALIYAYDPIGFAASIAAISKSGAEIPVVFHCHDTPVLGPRRIASLQDWIIRYALRHTGDAAFTIFPSKHRAPIWLDKAGDPRVPLIVPNGAARDFYTSREDWHALAQRRWESKRVLYLGSMGPENGQPQALRALAALHGDVKLDMAGFGTAEFRRELSGLAVALSLKDRVSISDWVADAERNRLAEQASVGLVL